MDMDMDGKFYIHGNPAFVVLAVGWCLLQNRSSLTMQRNTSSRHSRCSLGRTRKR